MHKVYLSLGSNLGNREKAINDAIGHIKESVGIITRVSSFYETTPWGFTSDNDFINAAVCVDTVLSPRQLLESTQRIELDMGRTEKTEGDTYQDRVIDIDILMYDDISIDERDLKIPHPLMSERDFVMKPLNEILE